MTGPTAQIPGPRPLPVLGNLLDLDLDNTIQGWVDMAGVYGPIFKLKLGGNNRMFVTGYELVNELCSRKDFVKRPVGGVRALRSVIGEGLFTADPGQESWELAHRVLLPAFGPLSLRGMFDDMHGIISQLSLKWLRQAADNSPIDVTADFTRLTLDILALCAMDTRLDSFGKDELHPFIDAMVGCLVEAQKRSVRPAWLSSMMRKSNQEFDAKNRLMHDMAAEVIARRRAEPSSGKKDLVDAMINGKDPVTGKTLSDETIVENMITFLIAGHETTAGLLSFAFALLMQNPKEYEKLKDEVDSVLGTGPMTPDHLSRLPFTKAVLRETLRLWSPIQAFTLSPAGDEPLVIGDKWVIEPADACYILLGKVHRDPSIYGEDADEFKPQRMLEENLKKLPPNSFKPFGHGKRACIGSEFALQEAVMAVAMLLQTFDFRLADPGYKLAVKQTMTVKPKDLYMHAKLRPGVEAEALEKALQSDAAAALQNGNGNGHASVNGVQKKKAAAVNGTKDESKLRPMTVFYGSNTGTCQGLADRLAMSALHRGFKCTAKTLNEAVDRVPTGHPVVFISSTHYEGQAPDNAAEFVKWLGGRDEKAFEGVDYTIFGCGNREWQETFQDIPIRLHDDLGKYGARFLATRGEADAGEGDVLGAFDTWVSDQLWPGVAKVYEAGLEMDANAAALDQEGARPAVAELPGLFQAKVTKVIALTQGEERPKYHMEVELPEGKEYQVGDYLDVLPENSAKDVEKLKDVLKTRGHDVGTELVKMLSTKHELSQPGSPRQLEMLIRACEDENDLETLEKMNKSLGASLTVSTTSAVRRPSVLQLLGVYPSIPMTPERLSTLLPPIRPRPYSISSSPSASPKSCTLTWSLVTRGAVAAESDQGQANGDKQDPNVEQGPVPGLASHYLASLKQGDQVTAALRSGQSRFRPPSDQSSTPMVMVCAGAGVAPFMGFLAERAELFRRNPSSGAKLAPALLFLGCRGKEQVPYAAELRKLADDGIVDVRYAFSRSSKGDGGNGASQSYVQDRIWDDRQDLVKLWDEGARVYVCGSQGMSLGVKETVKKVYREIAAGRCGDKSEAEVDEWWIEILRERYAVDVF